VGWGWDFATRRVQLQRGGNAGILRHSVAFLSSTPNPSSHPHLHPLPNHHHDSKDVIKSGGEWISSIALENAAVGHPKVSARRMRGRRSMLAGFWGPVSVPQLLRKTPHAHTHHPNTPSTPLHPPPPQPHPTSQIQEAAVIGIPHPKWDERPLLVVVPKPPHRPDESLKRDVLGFMAAHPDVARFAVPDDVLFVEAIPYGATGKVGGGGGVWVGLGVCMRAAACVCGNT